MNSQKLLQNFNIRIFLAKNNLFNINNNRLNSIQTIRRISNGSVMKDQNNVSFYSRKVADSQVKNQNSDNLFVESYKLSIEQDKLYDDHIRLTTAQRIALSIGSGLMAITDPYRHDMVATFGETTGEGALKQMYSEMLQHPEGYLILQDKPIINSKTIDIEALGRLPENTFGYTYFRFLKDNNVTPDTRKEVRFIDDKELAYVMQRYREVHDMIHALLGMPTNMLGEVLVKWIEATQTGLPMCYLGGIFGPIQLKNSKVRQFYLKTGLPWALNCGHYSESLFCIYYEKRFKQDLQELRNELRVPKIPQL